jgi:acetoin:2,6-dichlorophenolindophenol oxidoreductase subunit alpha
VVVTNNHYAYSTPNDREFACVDLVERAKGYGFEGYSIDGTNLDTCLEVIGGAVKRARVGRPPQLVVASILRLAGHGEHDDASYVTSEIKQAPFAADCLVKAEKIILETGLATENDLKKLRDELAAAVDEAVSVAQQEPQPTGEDEDWCAVSTRELIDRPE